MSRQRRRAPGTGRRPSALVAVLVALVGALLLPGAGHAALAPGDTADSDPAPAWGWEEVFFDGFDGAAGTPSSQWHPMLGATDALQDGAGHLDVGVLAQVRTHAGWSLPVGTQVRVTASLLMPDTGVSYAAFWVQHPNGIDPRELDVVESYGPLKPWGAQLGSHICYDDTPETAVNACAATGRAPELFPVTQHFAPGTQPWQASWAYSATFTVGGDTTVYSAADGQGGVAYVQPSSADPRRVPGNAAPFHLRLSNKALPPENSVPGGTRASMLVDWARVEVKYP